jgi:hypothetical protein
LNADELGQVLFAVAVHLLDAHFNHFYDVAPGMAGTVAT